MKKILCGFIAAALLFTTHNTPGQTTRVLKKTIELQMPGEEGSNGGAVAWHPEQKKYYSTFAGNASYPLAVFDAAGKRLSPPDTKSMIDIRGLWYNPVTKNICGNGFQENGWFSYGLNTNGIPENVVSVLDGLNQPGDQSIGVYNPKNKLVYFLALTDIVAYNEYGKQVADSTIHIFLNVDENYKDGEVAYLEENFNTTTVVFTGISKNEFGLLNYTMPQIELYNKNTGALSQILKLPDGAKAYDWFNFSYTNGIYFLFDKDDRKWIGYK